MDMDVDDIDLCLDPISAFLLKKLDAVKNYKEEMNKTASDLEGFIEGLHKSESGAHGASLEVCCAWKRIFHGKYVFGVEVKNVCDSDITNINCILQWKSTVSSLYKTQIYSTEEHAYVTTLKPSKLYTILLVVDQIDFSKHSEYHANCKIFAEKQQQTSVSNITFSVNDFGTSAEIKGLDLEVGDKVSVLAGMSAQNHIALVARLMGNASRHLENYLTVDCMLRVTEFDRLTFVFERISEAIDKSILRYKENDGVYYIDIFYRDKVCLRHILHQLHKNINQLYLLPRRYENELRKVKFDEDFGTQMFVSQILSGMGDSGGEALKKNLIDQIKVVTDFQVNVLEFGGVDESSDLSAEFCSVRNILAPKELKCDITFENIE